MKIYLKNLFFRRGKKDNFLMSNFDNEGGLLIDQLEEESHLEEEKEEKQKNLEYAVERVT